MIDCVNLFYEEPDPDRWIPFDRYPRKIIRELVRGKSSPGGVMRWYLNLRKGFDSLGVEYRVNDYRLLKKDLGSWACVIGKPQLIAKMPPHTPIIYGPGIASHPCENQFWNQANIKLLLISCEWFQKMYVRDLPISIPTKVWPAGIETDIWQPSAKRSSSLSLLLYDKVRWDRDDYEPHLIQPIRNRLESLGIKVEYLRYGSYHEDDYCQILKRVSGMVFLCEHETQGFAYQQALSSGVPILAWDRGGYWQDPAYYPHKVQYSPVTSVPYWDDRCGVKFTGIEEFPTKLEEFLDKLNQNEFAPRDYILENLTLEKCAQQYLDILNSI